MATVKFGFTAKGEDVEIADSVFIEPGDKIVFEQENLVFVAPRRELVKIVARVPLQLSVQPEADGTFTVSFERSGGDGGGGSGPDD